MSLTSLQYVGAADCLLAKSAAASLSALASWGCAGLTPLKRKKAKESEMLTHDCRYCGGTRPIQNKRCAGCAMPVTLCGPKKKPQRWSVDAIVNKERPPQPQLEELQLLHQLAEDAEKRSLEGDQVARSHRNRKSGKYTK